LGCQVPCHAVFMNGVTSDNSTCQHNDGGVAGDAPGD
jgi:hypothetical protein